MLSFFTRSKWGYLKDHIHSEAFFADRDSVVAEAFTRMFRRATQMEKHRLQNTPGVEYKMDAQTLAFLEYASEFWTNASTQVLYRCATSNDRSYEKEQEPSFMLRALWRAMPRIGRARSQPADSACLRSSCCCVEIRADRCQPGRERRARHDVLQGSALSRSYSRGQRRLELRIGICVIDARVGKEHSRQ